MNNFLLKNIYLEHEMLRYLIEIREQKNLDQKLKKVQSVYHKNTNHETFDVDYIKSMKLKSFRYKKDCIFIITEEQKFMNHENKKVLKKLIDIAQNKNPSNYKKSTSNQDAVHKRSISQQMSSQKQWFNNLNRENEQLANRLLNAQPVLKVGQYEKDYQQSQLYKQNYSRFRDKLPPLPITIFKTIESKLSISKKPQQEETNQNVNKPFLEEVEKESETDSESDLSLSKSQILQKPLKQT